MVVGSQRKLYQKWNFTLEVDGIEGEAGFGKVGPLEAEVAKVEYNSGGAIIPHKEAGRVSFSDITCERGATSDDALYDWFQLVADVASNSGAPQEFYKRGMTLNQHNREGDVVKMYRIMNAFPTKFSAGDWDGSADEVNIEVLELTYDYYEIENLEGGE